jgi:hypothetical protein
MSTNGQPTKLLDNAYVASQIAYDQEVPKDHPGMKAPPLPEGWEKVSHPPGDQKGKLLETAEAVELRAPNGQTFVAFAGSRAPGMPGSEGYADWVENNGKNGFGGMGPKYEAAAALGKLYKDENVVCTGHSLGGGLAKTMAEAQTMTGKHQGVSVSFDPAPIASREVLGQFGASNPLKLKCESISVVSNVDTLHAGLNTTLTQGMTPEIANAGLAVNEKVLRAEGTGRVADASGHSIHGLQQGNDPSKLTVDLVDKNNHIAHKLDFDRIVEARAATFDTPNVQQTLESAKSPDRGQNHAHAR